MLSLIKKDLKLCFSNKSIMYYLVLYLLPMILYTRLLGIEKANYYVILTIGCSLTIIPFQYDGNRKTYLLVHSLPVTRKEVVASKYVTAIINYIISVVYVWVMFNILNLFKFGINDSFSFYIIKNHF